MSMRRRRSSFILLLAGYPACTWLRFIPACQHKADGDLWPNLQPRRSKMVGVLRSSGSKNEDGRFLRSSGSTVVDGVKFYDFRLRRTKMGGPTIFRFRRTMMEGDCSIFSPEERRPPHLRSSELKVVEPLPSTVLDLRRRRSNDAVPSKIFGPEDCVEYRMGEGGGAGSYFFEDVEDFSKTTGHVESKTRTYHGRVESGRMAGRRGGAGQDWMPTEQVAHDTNVFRILQGIEETSPERLSRSMNKRNSILSRMRELNHRLTGGLSAVYPRDEKRSLFLAADQRTVALLSL